MDKIVSEILNDMDSPDFIPNDADGLLLIAYYLRNISESLARLGK